MTPELNGKSLDMGVDTGAAVSLMSKTTQKKLFPQAKLQKTTMKLQTYTTEALSVLGTLEVQVKYGKYVGKNIICLLLVVMLSKNTLGVKKCKANQKQHASRQVQPNKGGQVTKPIVKNIL